jgi:hypothetical protein
MREIGRNGVEAYFKRRVKEVGGLTRKFVSPGRRGVPDQLAIFRPFGKIYFVELKADGKAPGDDQLREHKRLRAMGCNVWVCIGKSDVDRFINHIVLGGASR